MHSRHFLNALIQRRCCQSTLFGVVILHTTSWMLVDIGATHAGHFQNSVLIGSNSLNYLRVLPSILNLPSFGKTARFDQLEYRRRGVNRFLSFVSRLDWSLRKVSFIHKKIYFFSSLASVQLVIDLSSTWCVLKLRKIEGSVVERSFAIVPLNVLWRNVVIRIQLSCALDAWLFASHNNL